LLGLTDIRDELPGEVCCSSVSHDSHAHLMDFLHKNTDVFQQCIICFNNNIILINKYYLGICYYELVTLNIRITYKDYVKTGRDLVVKGVCLFELYG